MTEAITQNNGVPPRPPRRFGPASLLRPSGTVRTVLFLAINLAGYAVVCVFWRYLCTGQWLSLDLANYPQDFARPVGQILMGPVKIFTHPWMILVSVLLLGAVVFVPVIMSVLYRLPLAVMFWVLVALLAHAPGMALALTAGCMLAGLTQLRNDFPYVAMLLGLLPVGAYLYLFGFSGTDIAAATPLQRWVMYGTFMGVLLAAAGASAAVLLLAKLTHYRPGVVWPLLAVLSIAPIFVFYYFVGADELEYAVIVNGSDDASSEIDGRIEPTDALFQPMALTTWINRSPRSSFGESIRQRVTADLQRRQRRLAGQCDRFIRKFPDSPRAPAVAWIKAQGQSVQLDTQAFANDLVKYTAAYPLAESAATWRRLAETWPDAPQAALAQWRLAELRLRGGDIVGGQKLLRQAEKKLQTVVQSSSDRNGAQPNREEIFQPPSRLPSAGYYADALFRTKVLLWLIDRNNLLNDARSAEAFAAWLQINPQQERVQYADQLEYLAQKYRATNMKNNLWLAVAQATRDKLKRIQLLRDVADETYDDAYVEANYELGRLVQRGGEALVFIRQLHEPEVYFQRVKLAGDSPWRDCLIQEEDK